VPLQAVLTAPVAVVAWAPAAWSAVRGRAAASAWALWAQPRSANVSDRAIEARRRHP